MYNIYNRKRFNNISLIELENELIYTNEKYIETIELIRKRFLNPVIMHLIATSIGGLYNNVGNLGACGKILTVSSENSLLVNELKGKLRNKLGSRVSSVVKKAYYDKYKLDCENRESTRWSLIGNCAEVRVTDNFLTRYGQIITDLTKIEFTNARRPRTQEIAEVQVSKVIPPCNNCQIIFYGK